MKLIIGLGNPGEEYALTYHNVGHLFLDYLAETRTKPFKKDRYFTYQDELAPTLVKTNVYMNESATAVRAVLRRFKMLSIAMLIVHDDSDLKLGVFRLSDGSGAAGHKGAKSIIAAVGNANFKRLRIGIRPTLEKTRLKAGDFVLKKITSNDKKILYSVFKEVNLSVIEKLT